MLINHKISFDFSITALQFYREIVKIIEKKTITLKKKLGKDVRKPFLDIQILSNGISKF